MRPWRRCAQEPGENAPRFALPDGRTVALAREGAALGEALVDPSALGLDLPPVAEAAFSAAMSHHDAAARKVAAYPLCLSAMPKPAPVSAPLPNLPSMFGDEGDVPMVAHLVASSSHLEETIWQKLS